MKKENKILMIIAIILMMLACKTAQVLPPKPVTLQTKERVAARLVPIISPADSAYIAALFECDSSKQVVLRQLAETKSKGVASDYSLKDGVFKYRIKAVHDTIYVPVVDSSLYKEVPAVRSTGARGQQRNRMAMDANICRQIIVRVCPGVWDIQIH